jgi:hypothetical protein
VEELARAVDLGGDRGTLADLIFGTTDKVGLLNLLGPKFDHIPLRLLPPLLRRRLPTWLLSRLQLIRPPKRRLPRRRLLLRRPPRRRLLLRRLLRRLLLRRLLLRRLLLRRRPRRRLLLRRPPRRRLLLRLPPRKRLLLRRWRRRR